MNTKLKERPGFELFKSYLKEAVAREVGLTPGEGDRWLAIGGAGKRRDILQALKKRLEEEYQVEFVYGEEMVSADMPFESVAIQLHHVYSTIYLMERINSKIRNSKN